MSLEKDVGELVGEVKYMRQDFRDMNKKMDKVLCVTTDVERNRKSIKKIWGTLWSILTVNLGTNILGYWWMKK